MLDATLDAMWETTFRVGGIKLLQNTIPEKKPIAMRCYHLL